MADDTYLEQAQQPKKRVKLTDGQRNQLAKRHLAGESYSDLAGFAGLTKQQVAAELRSQRTKDIMASQQSWYDGVVARMRLQMHMEGESTVARLMAMRDSNNENIALSACKFHLELIMPKKEIHEVNSYHHIDTEVAIEIRDALQAARPVQQLKSGEPSYAPYILTGTEGIETIEPTNDTSEGVPGGNGSGHQPEKDPDGKPEPPPN